MRLLLWIVLMTTAWVAPVRAQDAGCADDIETRVGPYETFPANNAQAVALNAPIRARYVPGELDVFDWQNAFHVTTSNVAVPGTTTRMGDTLVFAPTSTWLSGEAYEATIDGPSSTYALQFFTGNSTDVGAPIFDETDVSIRIGDAVAACGSIEDARRIDVQFVPATDYDGAPGDIEYLLFQTRGTGLEAPTLRARARNRPSSEIITAFVMPAADVDETFCLQVLAIDAVGHITEGEESCLDPRVGDYFQPICSVNHARTNAPVWLVGVFAMLLTARVWRRR